ncbi:hypothetical protein MUN89_02570 [Halobacillus salinarum]|uniref:Lipoprotein n=1 Tax=Halobacillus salinarum TaxID=2932257 RepID=A0ABY4EK60_9BACI|nr:hypothetical protein [Halobacillus salinarum]UOQ44857.1 hypothetical protein MUN89_02570 [Halobacillus salinarum]
MKKIYLLLAAVLLVGMLAACTEKTSTSPEEDGKDDQKSEENAKDNQSEDKEKDKEASDSEEKKKEEKEKEPEQPFKALQPADDAKPLKETMSKEDVNKMPVVEAHGDDRTRMIPVGNTLMKGTEDKTNGPLKKYRLVTYYGNPHSTQMGILGTMEPNALMKKLKEQTQAYSNADPSHPAVPTIELITTIAQRNPGPNGKYYHMTSKDDIEEYAKLAKENNALLMLDVQLGRDSVMHQVKLIEKWLKLPYVHLAIDTEFHVDKGEVPGVNLGHVDGSEVQKAVNYVDKLVEENNLPDKIVLVHQFTDAAVTNKQGIKPTDNVEVALNFDGWGDSPTKMSLYRKFVRNDPVQYGGFKVFYSKDQPVMKPEDVLKLDPNPAIINYQ